MTDKEFKFQYALGTISEEDLEHIAMNTTSKYILTILSKEKDWTVRSYVADNKSTPEGVLSELLIDKDYHVRGCASCNPNTPAKVLTKNTKLKLTKIKRWFRIMVWGFVGTLYVYIWVLALTLG